MREAACFSKKKKVPNSYFGNKSVYLGAKKKKIQKKHLEIQLF